MISNFSKGDVFIRAHEDIVTRYSSGNAERSDEALSRVIAL